MATQNKPRTVKKPAASKKRKPRIGSAEAILSNWGRWNGSKEELERLEKEVQEDRDREVLRGK